MHTWSAAHLTDHVLKTELSEVVARDRITTAEMLVRIAEFDARRLYLPAAYPSMLGYCVGELKMSEDMAYKRIHVARAARRFPAIFAAVAEGRVHLTGTELLVSHLTAENADELLAAAAQITCAEIKELLAERTAKACLGVGAVASSLLAGPEAVASREDDGAAGFVPEEALCETREQLASKQVDLHMHAAPTASPRFALKLSLSAQAHADLREARNLLAHALPSADTAAVVERALRLLVSQLRKRRFAETSQPRPRRSPANGRRHANSRTIPAAIRREVWERDGGKCTFRSDSGRECQCRRALQYDHIIPVARGGKTTAENLRLRCRAHNQLEAERTFGAGFMQRKREASRQAQAEAREAKRAAAAAKAKEVERARKVEAAVKEVIPALRNLGCSPAEARSIAARCEAIPEAPLEERLRCAQKGLLPMSARKLVPAAAGVA